MYQNNLECAIDAAYAAGKAIIDIYAREFSISRKNDATLVTEADHAADAIIAKELAQTGIPILSEESLDTGERRGSEYVWIVDPLDGTKDFIERTDDFSVMIGLVENGKPVVGVVYSPASDELNYAVIGEGARSIYKKNAPKGLLVSNTKNSQEARMVASRSHFSTHIGILAETLGIRQITRRGGNGIKLCMIAKAEADIFVNPTSRMGEWDLCAPEIIVAEAGGKVTDLYGEPLVYNKEVPNMPGGIVVSNGILHDNMRSAIAKLNLAPV